MPGASRQMRAANAAHMQRLARQQRRTTSMDPYYSSVTLVPVLTGGGAAPGVYTIAANGIVRGFSYALGQDMGSAGLPGVFAQACDTNIVTAGKTIGGRAVEIQGISCQILPYCRAAGLAAQVLATTSMRLLFNGSETNILLGPLFMIPGGNSMFAMNGEDLAQEPAIPGGKSFYGAMSNGMPGRDNILKIREGIIWQPEGESDSSLVIQITPERTITSTAPINEAAAAGIRGYAQPTAAAMSVPLMLQLHGRIVGPRSHIV